MDHATLLLMLTFATAPSAGAAARTTQAVDDRAERHATELGGRLRRLSSELVERRERLVLETLSLGVIAAAYDRMGRNDDPANQLARAAIAEATGRFRRETLDRSIEAASIAERLRTYERTGVLPPARRVDPGVFDFDVNPRRVLATAAYAPPELTVLSLDLTVLMRQLERYGSQVQSPEVTSRSVGSPVPPMGVPTPRAKAGPDSIPDLIMQLSADDSRRRSLAADELGQHGRAALPAVAALRKAAADPEARVRASAVLALGRIAPADPAVIKDLCRALQDKSEDVRFSARAVESVHDLTEPCQGTRQP